MKTKTKSLNSNKNKKSTSILIDVDPSQIHNKTNSINKNIDNRSLSPDILNNDN